MRIANTLGLVSIIVALLVLLIMQLTQLPIGMISGMDRSPGGSSDRGNHTEPFMWIDNDGTWHYLVVSKDVLRYANSTDGRNWQISKHNQWGIK